MTTTNKNSEMGITKMNLSIIKILTDSCLLYSLILHHLASDESGERKVICLLSSDLNKHQWYVGDMSKRDRRRL